jgi:F0F1-type ATP synthase epsilon subunit
MSSLKRADGRLKVKVFSPFQTFYQGDASSLSAANKTGPFDVLYDHANFFSLLTAGHVKVGTGFQDYTFPITRGIMKVTDNTVTVFIDV